MARKPRIEFPGALYHVISRGNQRQLIFHDKADRMAYLERLEHYRQLCGVIVYAYVLMANHIHILVETGDIPLSKFMQVVQFTYTNYYNRKYSKIGHLFQGRYKAILCDRDEYLLELVRYLHLNPARIRQRQDPWRYRWSSHGAYMGRASCVEVKTSVVLAQFGKRVGRARQTYLRFVKEGLGMGHEAKYYETVDQRLLGDERFVERVDRRTEQKREIEKKPRVLPFLAVTRAVADEYGISPEVLLRPGRQRSWVRARGMLVYLGREWSGMSTRELGRQMHRDASVISRLYGQYARNRKHSVERRLGQAIELLVNTHA